MTFDPRKLSKPEISSMLTKSGEDKLSIACSVGDSASTYGARDLDLSLWSLLPIH